MSLGWEQVKGWECLYNHREDCLFLFVYVDDFKMAGLKCNMKGMWSRIASVLDIEPPLKLPESTYLGCRQSEFPYDDDVKRIIENRRPLVDWCLKRRHQPSQGDEHDKEPIIDTFKAKPPMRGVDNSDVGSFVGSKNACNTGGE